MTNLKSVADVLSLAKNHTDATRKPCIAMDPRAGSTRAKFHLFTWPDKTIVADVDRTVFLALREGGHLDLDLERREAVRYGEHMQAWPIKVD